MQMHQDDARGREWMAHQLRRGALVMRLSSLAMREQGCTAVEPDGDSTTRDLDEALTGLESDLSYLEELAENGSASIQSELDRMDERLKRVIAGLKGPAP